ncbi:MAG: hypothetical protein CMJ58_05635 [Planctomycetaceae bacterium]|nr:hypothetical protein [Planctomycetaceae bacterium]
METEVPPTARSTRHRPRFSLLTLLLIATVAALTLAVIQLYGELQPLRAEVRRFRNEFGTIEIPAGQEGRIHAVRMLAHREREWKFRVYLPRGRTYRAYIAQGELPGRPDGMSDANYCKLVRSQTDFVEAVVEGGASFVTLTADRGNSAENIVVYEFRARFVPTSPEPSKIAPNTTALSQTLQWQSPARWMADEALWGEGRSAVTYEQGAFSPKQSLLLVDVRQAKRVDDRTIQDADRGVAGEGFMFWIEPVP